VHLPAETEPLVPQTPLVIVNPASRGGEAARDWPKAAAALRSHLGAFACRFTERAGDAVRIAREEALLGRSLLLTFGGDGTISETARGILESGRPAELGILPHGTGGDLARSLALPLRTADAARAILRGTTVLIDVGRVVFANGTEKSFVNAASIGLSAEVAERVNRGPGGTGRYARETIRAALEYSFPEVTVSVDGKAERTLSITTLSIHNGRFFGGGMKMAPDASVVDGRLDVVLVKKLTVSRLLRHAPLLYLGAHLGLAEVEHTRCARLEASPTHAGEPILVEVDGEVDRSLILPARFEVRPRALRVRLPLSARATISSMNVRGIGTTGLTSGATARSMPR
jgi:YegS/Rv2252/BmrU family lipid kinase